jgi:hypothetical protein
MQNKLIDFSLYWVVAECIDYPIKFLSRLFRQLTRRMKKKSTETKFSYRLHETLRGSIGFLSCRLGIKTSDSFAVALPGMAEPGI